MSGIFVSYSNKDKAIVNRIYQDLINAGVDVWLDERQIKVGDDIFQKVGHGIETYDYVGVVLSKSSIKSSWVKAELSAAFGKELETKKVIVLPIKIEECDIPRLISMKKYADFSRDYDSGLADLLEVLGQVKTRVINMPKSTITIGRRGQSSEPPQPIAFTNFGVQSGTWDLSVLIESMGDKEVTAIVTDLCMGAVNNTYQQAISLGSKDIKLMFYSLFLTVNAIVKASLLIDIPHNFGKIKPVGSKMVITYRMDDRVFSTRVGDCGGITGYTDSKGNYILKRIDPTYIAAYEIPKGLIMSEGQVYSAPLGFMSTDKKAYSYLKKGNGFDFDIMETRLKAPNDFVALSSFDMPRFSETKDVRLKKILNCKSDKKKLVNSLCGFFEPTYNDCVVASMSTK